MEIEHPFQVPLPTSRGAQGRVFSHVHLEFPFRSLGLLPLILSLLFREGSGSVRTAYLFHHPNCHQYNKTNLLEVVCLFVFLSPCFPCYFCILQVIDSVTSSSADCRQLLIWALSKQGLVSIWYF